MVHNDDGTKISRSVNIFMNPLTKEELSSDADANTTCQGVVVLAKSSFADTQQHCVK